MRKTLVLLTMTATILSTTIAAPAQPNVVVIPLSGAKATGDATPADVLEGRTFSNTSGTGISGTMQDIGAITITPGTSDTSIPEGHHNGSGTVPGDPDLVPANIINGVNIFGVDGTVLEASGNATPSEVVADRTFSNADGDAIGTMPDSTRDITPGATDQTITQGYHDGTGTVFGDADLTGTNIKNGITIFGVDGTVLEASGNATPSEVVAGRTFSNATGADTGTMPDSTRDITPGATDQTITQGYHDGTGTVFGDADLAGTNIRKGVTIFAVDGTALTMPACSSITTACQPSGNTCVFSLEDCAQELGGTTWADLNSFCDPLGIIQACKYVGQCQGYQAYCEALNL